MPSLQDFSLVKTSTERFREDFNLKDTSSAFCFICLNLLLGLQDDEIKDSLTDTNYLRKEGDEGSAGHDRGIDAIFIDQSDTKAKIHLFNFKHVETFNKTSNNFPSGEIDKIASFLNDLMAHEENMHKTVNRILYMKVQEIWEILESSNPDFVLHISANIYNGFESSEKARFERAINRHNYFTIEYNLMDQIVESITRKGKQSVDGKLKAIDKNFFEKSDGDIRALIVNVDAKDLIRTVLSDEALRRKVDLTDLNEIKNSEITEDAFEDNVRMYMRQRSKINRSIKKTALSEDSHRFFYFNNGVTITCDSFEYIKTMRAPIIELKNIQVVNGSQTIHALFEAFAEDSEKFEHIDILCRIYETHNSALSTSIAEYTNSQNPVKSRDIRSIDPVQQKLEQELLTMGLYYERKKGRYVRQVKHKRLDAEKAGQVLMAFFNKMPSEARNQKKLIFAEKYDDVFNDEVNADKVLLAYKLFENIEDRKSSARETVVNELGKSDESFLLYASYYILYIMGELARKDDISLLYMNLDMITDLYPKATKILQELIEEEKKTYAGHRDNYSDASFFKSNRPKRLFESREKALEIQAGG